MQMIYEIDSEGEGEYENRLTQQHVQQSQQNKEDEHINNLPQSKIIGGKDFQLLSTKNILGRVSYVRWRRNKNFYFALDMQKGRILCYKALDSKKPTTYYGIIKGQFMPQVNDTPQMIKLQSKKGKTFTLHINEDKDPKTIQEYLNTCFNLNQSGQNEDEELKYKGFFAMLGKGVTCIFKVPFRITIGILVSDKLPEKKNQMPLIPNQIFNEQKKKVKEKYIPMSGMFFGTSQIVKEILGSIAVLHGQYQEAESCFSLSQDITSGESSCAVALIFKPVLGTIDMVIMKMSGGDFLLERNLYPDIFKVRRAPKLKKKQKKKQIQAEKDRQVLEYQLGIDDTKMDEVERNDTEILYLKKNNGLLDKNDINKMHKWGQVINLGDVDSTKKREEDYQLEQDIINEMLDFYKKRKMNSQQGDPFEEDTCEFMIVYPSQEKMEEQEDEFEDTMEENFGEDTVINMERYQERYEKKWLPRVNIKQTHAHGNENNNSHVYQVRDGQMPSFQVQQSPFSKQKLLQNGIIDEDLEEENKKNTNEISQFDCKQQNNEEQEEELLRQERVQALKQELFQKEEKAKLEQQQQTMTTNTTNTTTSTCQNTLQPPKLISPTNSNQSSNRIIPITEQLQNDEDSSSSSEEEFGEGDDAIVKAENNYDHVKMTREEISQWCHNFKNFPSQGEERIPDAFKSGGKICTNKEIINTMRSVGKYILQQIGRKIISGDFNLTTVSFPIKAMIPKSALQTILYGTVLFPYYINLAVNSTDKVERLKMLIVATFGNFPIANGFLKPLNPILGETFQGSYPDGSKLYAEQTSHHPPVSSFLVIGPQKSYSYSGYYLYDAKAGFNSLTLKNKGKRQIIFHNDNQKITYDYGYEQYSGTFMGSMKHETLGYVEFMDVENNIKATITIGKVKRKPTDYLSGEILLGGNVVSRVSGTYNGFIEFDGIRYWDFRHVKPFQCMVQDSGLLSDHSRRSDKIELAKGNINKAQKEKERLEMLQRADSKLRKEKVKQNQKEQKKQDKKKK